MSTQYITEEDLNDPKLKRELLKFLNESIDAGASAKQCSINGSIHNYDEVKSIIVDNTINFYNIIKEEKPAMDVKLIYQCVTCKKEGTVSADIDNINCCPPKCPGMPPIKYVPLCTEEAEHYNCPCNVIGCDGGCGTLWCGCIDVCRGRCGAREYKQGVWL